MVLFVPNVEASPEARHLAMRLDLDVKKIASLASRPGLTLTSDKHTLPPRVRSEGTWLRVAGL